MNQVVKKFLQGVGDKNKYQILLVIFLFFISLETNFLMIGPTFIFMNPLFRCAFSDQLVDESQACSSLSQCQISNSFTLVAHMELYCDKQAERNIIQSIIPIGFIVGLLIVNSLSDIKGRKFALIFVQIVGIVGVALTILGGFLQALWIIIIGQFLCGFCGYPMLVMIFVVPTQFCEDMFMQKSLIAINFALSTGTILIGVLYYFYNIWYNYLIFIVLITMGTLLLISIFFLVESPFFLFKQKRMQQCLQSLKTIARFNNKNEQFQTVSINFPSQNTQQNENEAPSILSIIKDKRYLKMIIILLLTELGANLYFFATGYALNQIGYEYGTNMIGSGIVDFLCYITLSFTITKIPRKSGLIIFYGVTVALGFLFFIDTIKDQRINSFILMSVIRYFFTLGFTLIIIFLTTEAFPMNIQATCAGIIEAIAQVGSFLGPIIITFCINLQFHPIIAISILALATILIPLLFMDTPTTQSTQIRQTNQQFQLGQSIQNINVIQSDQRALELPSLNGGSTIFRSPMKISID